MNIVVVILKALPFLLALITLTAILLIGITFIRAFQQRIDKTTLLLGIFGLLCLIVAILSWRAVFNYWRTGAG